MWMTSANTMERLSLQYSVLLEYTNTWSLENCNNVTLLPYSMDSGIELSTVQLADIHSLQYCVVLACSMNYSALWFADNMLSRPAECPEW